MRKSKLLVLVLIMAFWGLWVTGSHSQARETAGEMEVFVNPNFFNILGTSDSTLLPLYADLKDPKKVNTWLKQNQFSREIRFEYLSYHLKKELILLIERSRNRKFLDDRGHRKIPGLVVKEALNFKQERKGFEIGGRNLISGKKLFLSQAFEAYVEFGNSESTTVELSVMELHLRNKKESQGATL